MKTALLITLPMLFISTLCQAQAKKNNSLRDIQNEIEAANKKQFDAFAKGDYSLFINCYTSDCWIMAPNAPTFSGIDAAADFFKIAYGKTGVRNGKFMTIAIFGNGTEFVTEEGFWETRDASNRSIATGKYLVLWKKTAGGWKRFRDCFNSDGINKYQNEN